MKQKYVLELIGTAMLTMVVLGSGIMAQKLAAGNEGLALLANSIATGCGLYVLIQCLSAHMNPIVSLVELINQKLSLKEFSIYIAAQMSGAVLGILGTHIMFNLEVLQISTTDRNQWHLLFSEVLATFGLICTISLATRKNPTSAPATIAAFITSAYWFTSSTAFANPAITLARTLTNTFGGMAPNALFSYIIAQICGAVVAAYLIKTYKE